MKRTRLGWIVGAAALTVASFVTAQITSSQWKPANALPQVKGKAAIMIQVQQDGNRELLLRYRLPDLVAEETAVDPVDGKRTRLSLGNAPLRGNKGAPVLPVIPVQFVVPIGKEIGTITVSGDRKMSLTLASAVEFGSTPVPLMANATVKRAVPDAAIYENPNPYPSSNNELVSLQQKRGVKIGIVNLYPVTYFPLDKRVDYCKEYEIKVTFVSSASIDKGLLRLRSTGFDLKKLGVENPEAIQDYRSAPADATPPEQHMMLDPAESFQYVVITNEAMRDATTDVTVNTLLDNRKYLGLTDTLVTIESILSSYTGVDNAEKVRNFIIDAYTNWETEYIVLGGDVNIIPIRMLYVADDGGSNIPSDLYYQCLDGNYNSDGDKFWGEPTDGENGGDVDLFAEVNVGRISAETVEEMSNAVYKILAYEGDKETESYLRNSCMVGEELGSNFGSGEFGFAHPYMNEIKNGSSASGYTTTGFRASAAFTVDSLDDYDRKWPVDSIVALINSNKYSIVNHLGHANIDNVMKMSNQQADELTNTRFPFVFSQGCFPGDMTSDCIAEHLTTSTRSGLFAGIFNSHYGWGSYNESYETLDGPSQRINRQFWDACFGEFIYNIGAINADSHEDNVWDINGELIRWCIYETNLFGDPYTVIRGQSPGPNVAFDAVTVDDESGGNNDRIINPGERINLSIALRNIGNSSATGTGATLTINDEMITVVNSTLTFGDMPCCGVVTPSAGVATILIDSECPSPYAFPVTLEISDNSGNNWVATFTLSVHTSYTVTGKVLTLTGSNPISGATVAFTGPLSGVVTSGVDGAYSFSGIEGVYSVTAAAQGYLMSSAMEISLPPGAPGVDFLLGRPQMSFDPVAIAQTLEVNDSVTIPVRIMNSGDMDLLVTPKCRNVAVALGKQTPRLVTSDVSKVHGANYTDNPLYAKAGKITPPEIARNGKIGEGSQKVLYLNTILYDNTPDQFAQGLAGLPNVETVDFVFGYDFTPDLAYLMQYDVVVVAANYPWGNAELTGNTLADYVDAGGSVCLLVAAFANDGGYGLDGRIITADYLPLQRGGPGEYSSAVSFESHPITKGIKSLETMGPVSTSMVQGEGQSLGSYSTGYLIGAVNRLRPVVAINVYPGDYTWGGDLIQMMGNTFDYFSGSKWMNISPNNTPMTIAAGYSAEVQVRLKSVNLFGGLYAGEITLEHNDPLLPGPLLIPVELTVDGFKSLSATPVSADFGNLWLGLKDTTIITFTNTGTQKTIINAMTSSNAQYTADAKLPLSILAGRSVSVGIIYAPAALGSSVAALIITSDAEDNPSISITVSGTATPGPEAHLAPTDLTFNLDPNDVPVDRTAVLSNRGGDVLSYRTFIRQKSGPSSAKRTPPVPGKIGDVNKMIYSPYNYRNEYALDRVIVAFVKGKTSFADPSLAQKLGNGTVRELGIARIPQKGVRAYTGKKLVVVPLANNDRTGVLEAIKLLRKDINVAYVEPDYRVKAVGTPNDPMFPRQYALSNSGQTGGTADADISALEGWDIITGKDSDVILGIIDTGIDYLHPDLEGNLWVNKGEVPENGIDDDKNGYADDVYGYDFAYDDNDPMDVYGHGTHCAGIAAGRGNDGVGICGVSWGAKLMAAKFIDDEGNGYTSDAIDAIVYATAMGATITSNSWGGGGYDQSLADAIAESGLFIAAAGNDGRNADNYPAYPAAFELDNIISVAATDHNDNLAPFSNYGQLSVDLGAPGVDILSSLPENQHETWSGTSMATPHVSGCAVLLKTYNPLISSAEIKAAILDGVDSIAALAQTTATGGRLNLAKALEAVAPPWISLTPTAPGVVDVGAEQQFTVTANANGLVAGTWVAEVVYKTDDPNTPEHFLTVTANIAPCRTLAGSSETVAFSTVWAGRDTVVNAVLVNSCNAPVTVTSVAISNQLFASEIAVPFTVSPFGSINLPIRFSPKDAGTYTAAVTISSDAEDYPELTVNLQAASVTPPVIAVNPVEIDRTLPYGEIRNIPVTLTNTGGADFQFRIKTVQPPKTKVATSLSDAVVYAALTDNTIRKVNPVTGEFMGDPIPKPIKEYGAEGLAFDGDHLYYIHGSSDVIVIDPETGIITDTVKCKVTDTYVDGLGVTDDFIILGDISYSRIIICDKTNGDLVSMWELPGYYGGLGASESRKSVFCFNAKDNIVEERAIIDGKLMGTIPVNDYVVGVGYSEAARVLVVANPYNSIQVIDPQTGAIISTLPVTGAWAIAADEAGSTLAWLQPDVFEGTVPFGSSITFNAVFNSEKRLAGRYSGILSVQHRRPVPPGPFAINCTMTVLPEKRCAASPAALSFTETWVGRTDTLQITLVNTGNAATTVASLASNSALFTTLGVVPFTIEPFDSVMVPVSFSPKKAGTFTGKLTVVSDAVKLPEIDVALKGVALKPPVISYSPKQLTKTMLPNNEVSATVNLKNTGGAAYPFNVSVESVEDAGSPGGRAKLLGINWNGLYQIDPTTGNTLSAIPGNFAYGPCAYDGVSLFVARDGSTTIDVLDPLSGSIVRSMVLDGDSAGAVYEMGMSDNYLFTLQPGYSRSVDGYIVNIHDKNTGATKYTWMVDWAVETLCNGKDYGTLFMFNYRLGQLETRRVETGEIVATTALKEYGWNITYSRSLDVLFMAEGQTVTLVKPASGEVIGSYMLNDYMQIAADETAGVSWLATVTSSASVSAKGRFDVSVKFTTTRMFPGTYKANIRIAHCKGWEPGPFIIPCELTVLPIKKLAVVPTSMNFGTVWIGKESTMSLTLKNDGNVSTKVYSIANLNRVFRFDPQAAFTVAPFSSLDVTARFTPNKTGSAKDAALIVSDAIDLPLRIVQMTGSGINPPAISIDPKQFTVQVPQGGSADQTLSLNNSGGAPYNFTIYGRDLTVNNPESALLYIASEGGILKLNPTTFEPDGAPIASDNGYSFDGLAFDGTYLYVPLSNSADLFMILKIDPDNPGVVDTLRTDLKSGWCSGLGVTGDLLIALESDYGQIYIFDKETGTTLRSFGYSGYGALTAAAERESFFVFNYSSWTLEELNLSDGLVKQQIPVPGEIDFPTGAGYSNAEHALFVCDYNGRVVKMNPDNGDVLASGSSGLSGTYGFAADEATSFPAWLKVTSKKGTVPAGGKLDININFDATELQVGKFVGELRIAPDSNGAPGPFVVPCNLTVDKSDIAAR